MPRQQIVFLVWHEWTLLCKWLNHIRWQRTAHWWPWCEPIQWLIEEGRCFTKGLTVSAEHTGGFFLLQQNRPSACPKAHDRHAHVYFTLCPSSFMRGSKYVEWISNDRLPPFSVLSLAHPSKKTSDGSTAAVTSANAWQLQSSICMMGEKGPTA